MIEIRLDVIDAGMDICLVASPHGLHYEHAKAALDAGAHVLCEKPFTVEPGQMSADRIGYFREMRAISGRPGPLALARALWERIGWAAPNRMYRTTMIRYDAASGRWR